MYLRWLGCVCAVYPIRKTEREMNKTQRLQKWIEEHPSWGAASYGEFMHVGANQTLFRVALKGLSVTSGMRALDIACAVGGNARWLASLYGCSVSGIDINEGELEVARDLADIEGIGGLCTFLRANANELPFEAGIFDLAISTDIFDPGEVRRVLKPGGAFIISVYWDDPRATFSSLASAWGLELESGLDVTALAFAFHRAKEEEARLLLQAGMLEPRELVEIINENVTPYAARGGRHLLMRLRKPD